MGAKYQSGRRGGGGRGGAMRRPLFRRAIDTCSSSPATGGQTDQANSRNEFSVGDGNPGVGEP